MTILYQKRKQEKLFHWLLAVLFLSDTFYVIAAIVRCIENNFDILPNINTLYANVLQPLSRFTEICNILTTIALMHSRVACTKNPIHHRNALLSRKFKIKLFLKYIISIVILSIFLAIFCYWELDIKIIENSEFIVPSSYRKSLFWIIFYGVVVQIALLRIAPFLYLIWNTRKLYGVLKRNPFSIVTVNPGLLPVYPLQSPKQIFKQKRKRTKSIISISILFCIFHAPRICIAIVELGVQIYLKSKNIEYHEMGPSARFWFELLCITSELFLVLNSSFNTLMYLNGGNFCVRNPRTNRSNVTITRMGVITKIISNKYKRPKIDKTTISPNLDLSLIHI